MKLVYDIASCPKGLDIANFTKIFEQHHVIFWDSAKGGTKPRVYSDEDLKNELKIVDVKGEELDIEMYSKIFKDKEFWDKELHYCKNSPIYYFSNYVTTEFPATQEKLSAFLKSLDLENIVADDAEQASEAWELQKAKMVKATAHITVEHLQERKPIIEALKASYATKIYNLEEELKTTVRLFAADSLPEPEKVRVTNLVYAIRQKKNFPEKYAAKYRDLRGRWRSPLLYATPYHTLLEILSDCIKEEVQLKKVK